MIEGRVDDFQAIVKLSIQAPGSEAQIVDATVDTGLDGFLTLAESVIDALKLPFAGYRRGMLADGSIVRLETYLAEVDWHGSARQMLASKTKSSNLLGMSLLLGSRLDIEVTGHGEVTIEQLPSVP